MVVFGGFDGRNRLGDICVLDLSTLNWSICQPVGTSPTPRFGMWQVVCYNHCARGCSRCPGHTYIIDRRT